jgi:glycosyltransferase involved in cell wall biosynthesis
VEQASNDRPVGVSVVIPCLDEEQSIAQVVECAQRGIRAAGLPGEVVVVDNGCSDASAARARAAGAWVVREDCRGYGAAVRRGFTEARYSILVMGDADMTYDFTRVGELVDPIRRGDADFVIGNRMQGVRPGAMPALHRYVGTPALAFLLRLALPNCRVRDPNCGLRAISCEAFARLRCVASGMEFASEMVIQAARGGLRVAECDIEYHPRVGESKLRTFRDGWRHLRFILLYSPTMLVLGPGFLLWLVGLALSAPLAFGPVMIEDRRVDIHFMIIAGMLNVVSIQIITVGMLAKAFAHLTGIHVDPMVARLYRWFRLEPCVVAGVLLVLTGLSIVFHTVYRWVHGGFGSLDEARPLFFALLCVVNGVQLGAAAYLFSILALPHQAPPPADSSQERRPG